MHQKVICVVAGKRSGTTALGHFLASTGLIKNFGEIFHSETPEAPGSFFGFCARQDVKVTDFQTRRSAHAVCDSFMKYLEECAGGRHVLIDVKFNSWMFLQVPWRYPQQEPFFLAYLKERAANFIFLQRENLADQILSEHVARLSQKWHQLRAEDLPKEMPAADIGKLKTQARMVCLAEKFFTRALSNYGKAVFLKYETTFDDGILNENALRKLSKMLEQELLVPRSSKFEVNNVDKSKVVPNYHAAKAAIDEVATKIRRVILS
jgi:LPS sulfotransferase NodH